MKTEKLAHWAEIISSLVVVVTLVFLIHEVQRNTRALERQSELEQAAALNDPFFEAPELASVLAKIKEVDGPDPVPAAFVERYDLTPAEAILWERHLARVWYGLWTDHEAFGPQKVDDMVKSLLPYGDNRLYWEGSKSIYAGTEFGAFVDSLAAEIGAGS